jgi:hypothetical protein
LLRRPSRLRRAGTSRNDFFIFGVSIAGREISRKVSIRQNRIRWYLIIEQMYCLNTRRGSAVARKLAVIVILTTLLTLSVICAAMPMRLIGAQRGDYWGDQFGSTCEGMGDINGDGYNDFLLSIRFKHELRLYLGGSHPLANPPAVTWSGLPLFSLRYGFKPINIGDIDCDGANDFICGFGPYNTDTLKLITGLKNLNQGNQYILHVGDALAPTICGGGDNNADGRPEFWINFEGLTDSIIHGYSGCDLLDTIPDCSLIDPTGPNYHYLVLSNKICTTYDLNGDGIPDIVYGQAANVSPYRGRICIHWGGPHLSTHPDLIFYSPNAEAAPDLFGTDIEGLGDINGDGIDDLWVCQQGRNYIYFGGRPFDTIPDISMDWPYMYSDVENVGDINHDGWNDVILVRDDYLINRVSYIYCYPGMDTLVDVVYSDDDYYAVVWLGSLCCVGIDHSWAGDIDGDEIDDILLSARSTEIDNGDYGIFYIQAGWNGQPVDVTEGSNLHTVPNLMLAQNRPNPFNSGTTIEFLLQRAGYTELKIYNLLGQLIASPVQQNLSAGEHRALWDGKDQSGSPTPTGVYLYKITSGGFSSTKKMVLLK